MSSSTLTPEELMADKGYKVLVSAIVLYVLVVTSVALRFSARRISKAPLWWDDWFILLALARCCLLHSEEHPSNTVV